MSGPAPKGLQLKVAKTVTCLACNLTFKTRNKNQHTCNRLGCQKLLDGRSARGYRPTTTSKLSEFLD